MISIQTKI